MLKPQAVPSIPAMTVRAAKAAFPKGHRYLTLRDNLGTIFTDEMFKDLFPKMGRPAEAPWRLALVTIIQHAEGLSDRQAADAVRDRLSLKYLLGLELDDPGFDYSILSRFRDRLVEGSAENLLLDALIEKCLASGLIKDRGKIRTDSTHIISKVRDKSRLEFVAETLRVALNDIARLEPIWLQQIAPQEWFSRYGRGITEIPYRKKTVVEKKLSSQVGCDGFYLLGAVYGPQAPRGLGELESVELLRRCWLQEYMVVEETVVMRGRDDLPSAPERLRCPYETDMRYGTKGTMSWQGYRVHLSETCDNDQPHLIVHSATTPAYQADQHQVRAIHKALKEKKIQPAKHFVDNNYVTSKLLVDSQAVDGVGLIGPIKAYREFAGLGIERFHIDWANQVVTCPEGQRSQRWRERITKKGKNQIEIGFSTKQCRPCPSSATCSKTAARMGRTLALLPQAQYEAREAVKQLQDTEAWKREYQIRSGSEGTFSQAVRLGLRTTRYLGFEKASLSHQAFAAGINLQRLSDWFDGIPRTTTRTSRFAALRH